MRAFRELKVWERAHRLAIDTYKVTARFPKEELYGLTSQIRRASVSIPSNIAEGCGRRSKAELAHFLSISLGSASELEYQLLLSRDLGLIDRADHQRLEDTVTQIKMMFTTFIRRVD